MKQIATFAMMLTVGAAGVYGQQGPLTFSGTAGPSTVVLKTGVDTSEYNFTGNGMFGAFTFKSLSASAQSLAAPPAGCNIYATVVAGAGVFRFADGSLLIVNSGTGTDCIQFTATGAFAHCIRNFKIAGGTGRFQNVPTGGTVTLDELILPVFPDNPVALGGVTGTGTISEFGQ
jgi:hypothetical protein